MHRYICVENLVRSIDLWKGIECVNDVTYLDDKLVQCIDSAINTHDVMICELVCVCAHILYIQSICVPLSTVKLLFFSVYTIHIFPYIYSIVTHAHAVYTSNNNIYKFEWEKNNKKTVLVVITECRLDNMD